MAWSDAARAAALEARRRHTGNTVTVLSRAGQPLATAGRRAYAKALKHSRAYFQAGAKMFGTPVAVRNRSARGQAAQSIVYARTHNWNASNKVGSVVKGRK